MRTLILILFFFCSTSLYAQQTTSSTSAIKIAKDSAWVMKNTSINSSCSFMSAKEKEIVQWLNIARMYPDWYIYFNKLGPSSNPYENGLYKRLKKMQGLKSKLVPDSMLWAGAKCHAYYSGLVGHIGHNRLQAAKKCPNTLKGECIHYGNSTAQDIILGLLIDKDVESLGHRKICLSPTYKFIGVSSANHKSKYKKNVVLDFR